MRTTTKSSSNGPRRSAARRTAAIAMSALSLLALSACGSDEQASTTTKPSSPSTVTTDPDETSATTDTPDTTATTDTTEETTEETTDETVPETTDETVPETIDDTVDETVVDTISDTVPDTTSGTGTDVTLAPAIQEALDGLLLTAEEVGPTFVEDPTFDGGDGTTPCGIDVEGQVPSVAETGVQLNSDDPALALVEQIKVYDTAEEATQAFALATTGFACGSANGLELGDLTDVSAELGIESYAVTVAAEGVEGVIFLAIDTDAIYVLQFQQEAGATPAAGIPTPITLATAAIDKIEAALQG